MLACGRKAGFNIRKESIKKQFCTGGGVVKKRVLIKSRYSYVVQHLVVRNIELNTYALKLVSNVKTALFHATLRYKSS